MIPLSVLDLATVATGSTPAEALGQTTDMAVLAERLGYQRLWVAEHHAMPAVASSAPAVLLAHLASATTRIRVGAGGVMLPNHAPLVIAEQFATLEALHPHRIDLGLGRAPGTDHKTARALRRSGDLTAASFPDDVVELINYLLPHEERQHPTPTPGAGYLPEVWLLGSSTYSAQLAAALGLPFSFAYHFAPELLDAAVALYRDNFTPSFLLSEPHLMVAASVLCAPSKAEANWLAGSNALSVIHRRTGVISLLPSPEEADQYPYTPEELALIKESLASHIIGDPDDVKSGLDDLVARTNANELMISTRTHSFDARARSFALLAEAWGLSSN
jgi:luciferase family oxidoreductase group 1